jgi:hypothetical protein
VAQATRRASSLRHPAVTPWRMTRSPGPTKCQSDSLIRRRAKRRPPPKPACGLGAEQPLDPRPARCPCASAALTLAAGAVGGEPRVCELRGHPRQPPEEGLQRRRGARPVQPQPQVVPAGRARGRWGQRVRKASGPEARAKGVADPQRRAGRRATAVPLPGPAAAFVPRACCWSPRKRGTGPRPVRLCSPRLEAPRARVRARERETELLPPARRRSPPGARGQVHAAVALDDVAPPRVDPVDADHHLGARARGAFEGKGCACGVGAVFWRGVWCDLSPLP